MAIKSLYPTNRPSLDFNFVGTRRLDPRLTFSRASTGTYVDANGLFQTAAIDEPRFNYDLLTGENQGLLVEAGKTNFVSNNTSPAAWVTGTFVNETTFPIKNLQTTRVTDLIDGDACNLPGGPLANGYYSTSIYIDTVNSSCTSVTLSVDSVHNGVDNIAGASFTLSSKTFGPVTYPLGTGLSEGKAYAIDCGSGIYRLVLIVRIAGSTFTGSRLYLSVPPQGSSYAIVAGGQIEQGASPTSLILTSGTSLSRSADLLSAQAIDFSTGGTLFARGSTFGDDFPIASLNDGTAAKEVELTVIPRSGAACLQTSNGDRLTSGGGSKFYEAVVAASVSPTSASVASDGLLPKTKALSPAISGLTQLDIGKDASGNYFNGPIKAVRYFPGTVSTDVLTALSLGEDTKALPPTNQPTFSMGITIDVANTVWTLRSAGTVNYDVDWGDGQKEFAQTSNAKAHTYAQPGLYKVAIKILTGIFKPYFEPYASDKEKITSLLPTSSGWSFGSELNESWYGASNISYVDENINTSSVTTFDSTWRLFKNLKSFPLLDTSSATRFSATWYECYSLKSFPLLNTSNVTSLYAAWVANEALTSFPLIDTSKCTEFTLAWATCRSLASFPAINTSKGTNFYGAWVNNDSLASFPTLDMASGTDFGAAWQNCSVLTSFPSGINTGNGIYFGYSWYACATLASFPTLNFSKGVFFNNTWQFCGGLTSFPSGVDLSKGTTFTAAWAYCNNVSFTSFPPLNLASGIVFDSAWQNCDKLTSFPSGINLSNGTSFLASWFYCPNLTSFPNINLSKGQNFQQAWVSNTSLTSFPPLNLPSGTNFNSAWSDCTGLTSFPSGINISNGTSFPQAWQNCTSLSGFPPLNLGKGTDFYATWFGCNKLSTFPSGINVASGTFFQSAWQGCTGLTSFPPLDMRRATGIRAAWLGCNNLTSFPSGINLSSVTDVAIAWRDCSKLTSFPSGINTGNGTDFAQTWMNCSGLTSFPVLNTASGVVFANAWQGCNKLTSFPSGINTGRGTNFISTWQECSGLTNFPALLFGSGTDFSNTWFNCLKLASFPSGVNLSNGVYFTNTWRDCGSLVTFPSGISFSNGTTFYATWYGCTGLTSFPAFNLGKGVDFSYAWLGCRTLSSFPSGINISSGTTFQSTWEGCTGLTSFPALNFSKALTFPFAWQNCNNLATFPSGLFNTCSGTNFTAAWAGAALTAQSITNILVSINAANTSSGTLGLNGGTNAAKTTWTASGNTAYNALVARGWTIAFNP